MRKTGGKLQVAENGANKVRNLCLTQKDKNGYILHVTQKKKDGPKQTLVNVRLVPTPEENAIFEAAMKKHGLKKAVDVVRMALRQFAKAENLELAS